MRNAYVTSVGKAILPLPQYAFKEWCSGTALPFTSGKTPTVRTRKRWEEGMKWDLRDLVCEDHRYRKETHDRLWY
jgi:hypothetical protein